MRDLPCPIPPPPRGHTLVGAPVKPVHHGIRTWHRSHDQHVHGGHHLHVGLRHKIAVAGGIGSFLCAVGAGALAIWTAAAAPWSTTPVVPIPEPSSVAIFASGIALALSNRRAKP